MEERKKICVVNCGLPLNECECYVEEFRQTQEQISRSVGETLSVFNEVINTLRSKRKNDQSK